MADLLRDIEKAAAHVQVDWTPERRSAAEQHTLGRLRRRSQLRTGVVMAAAFAVVFLIVMTGIDRFVRPLPDVPQTTALAPSLDVLRFADGSMVRPIRPGTVVRSEKVTRTEIEVTVASGAARFDVEPNPERTFVVRAGQVSILVVGTEFTVAREQRVGVSVDHGQVLVTWQDGQAALTAGESGQFPPEPAQPVDMELEIEEPSPSASASAAPRAVSPKSPAAEAAPTWQALARQGQHVEAYEALQREGPGAIRNTVAELMLAADVARLSGHASQAVAALQKVVSNHGGDPRAPLAAFTLGRVLLDELGRPGQAAEAFAAARRLAPGGALAQDALAREVEALSKAGQAVAARQRALEYVRRYPEGRRLISVRRYGGLE